MKTTKMTMLAAGTLPALLLIAATAWTASTAETPARDDTLAPMEITLDVGTEALLLPRPGSGTVLITVAVPAGSQNEPPEMAGLSHYLEHLLFDGFDQFDERGVTEAFEERSAYVNAFTRDQATIFFALAPVEEAEATASLLTGMLTRSKIVPETFEKERKVILEELAKDDSNPDQVKEERLRSALWRGTPLEQPVGGSETTVAATDRETAVRYWKNRYRPSSWRVLITGDLPADGLRRVLEAMTPLEASPPLPPAADPLDWSGWGRWEAVEAPEGAGSGGGMPPMGGMGHGGPPAAAGPRGGTLALILAAPSGADRTGLEIVARWLADPDGPLTKALVPQFAETVSVSLQPRFHRDVLRIDVDALPDTPAETVLTRLLGALDAADGGPADGDVVRIREAWQAERVLTGQRLHYAAMFYGESLLTARDGLLSSIEPAPVTPDAVRAVAAALLADAPGRRRAAWIGPGGPDARTALPEAAEIAPPEGDTAFSDGPFGSLVTTLPNGLVVGVLPETGGDVFGIHLLVADRSLREPGDLPGIADFVHRLLPAGTALSGSAEISRRLERAGIELKAADSPMIPFDDRYHVPDFSYVRMEGPARSLETGLELLSEMIREPSWDDDGIRAARTAHRQSQGADNRGGALAGRRLYMTLLGPNHPLTRPVSGVPGDPPDIERVREFMGTWPDGYFASDRMILTIASPEPVERTLEMVEDVFGGGEERPPKRGPYPEPAPGETTATDGDSPQMTMLWGRLIDIPDAERTALLVAVDALSDRMVAVIREREGLAYRLGAGVRDLPGGRWMVVARVGTRPDNEDRVTTLMAEISKTLVDQPLPEEELRRLAARQRRSEMLRNLSAASRAYRLGRALFEGPSSPLRFSAAQRAEVSADPVREAPRRYLGMNDMTLVIAR